MNWEREIETYRVALLRQLTLLLAGIGLVRGSSVTRLSKVLYLSALWVLRPAESATRRLVAMRAQGVTAVALRLTRLAPSKPIPRGTGVRLTTFPLFDPSPRSGSGQQFAKSPRMTVFGYDDAPVEGRPLSPTIEDDKGARRLCGRIETLF